MSECYVDHVDHSQTCATPNHTPSIEPCLQNHVVPPQRHKSNGPQSVPDKSLCVSSRKASWPPLPRWSQCGFCDHWQCQHVCTRGVSSFVTCQVAPFQHCNKDLLLRNVCVHGQSNPTVAVGVLAHCLELHERHDGAVTRLLPPAPPPPTFRQLCPRQWIEH